jgi:hypothetical protein
MYAENVFYRGSLTPVAVGNAERDGDLAGRDLNVLELAKI